LRHVRWRSDYGYYLQLFATFGWTSLFWLPLLPQRTLVMAGRDDPLVPTLNSHILAALIRDARLVLLDDGHLFMLTSPIETARLVTEFLAG
jgi:pimeloyl-ACP methyl ester carboxylesterase